MKLDDALKTRGVPVAYRAPFAIGECWVDERAHGQSILEIVQSVPNLPRDFWKRGCVQINGEIVPKELWPHVRPKPTSNEFPIAVTLHMTLGSPGGSGGGGAAKSVIGIVAALALVVLTAGIGSGFAGTLLGIAAIGPGTFGAAALAAGVGLAGALAISALTAPPTAPTNAVTPTSDVSDSNTDQRESASASGNVLDRGGAIPRVIGTRKIFPPLAAEPIVELVSGDDEVVEAVYILNGPHLLEDPRLGNVAIADSDDIEIETREGWPADTPLTLTLRQGRTAQPQLELSVHRVTAVNPQVLVNAGDPTKDLPVWHGLASRNSPDEIWLHLTLPQGLSSAGSANEIVIPFRMRMRKRGSLTWINLPEFHLSGATLQQLRRQVKFKWKNTEPLQAPPTSNGFYAAFTSTPGQTAAVGGVTAGWAADSYFIGSGTTYLVNAGYLSSGVQNLNMIDNGIEFYLSEAVFPKGIYEFQIMRGATYTKSSFTPSTYVYSSLTQDFFSYNTVTLGVPAVVLSRTNLADRVIALRFASIWNEHPIQSQGFSLIAIRARNRSIQQLSVQASGYVRDWDGSAWANWTTTSNPAPHYVDILSGQQNIDPLPDDLRDDTTLVDWRSFCDDGGFEVDSIINDARTQDALQQIASWGYARPYQSDVYSVIIDRDRTGDAPVQVFSRRNSANMKIEMAFPRLPAGFNVTYRDDLQDDDAAQLTVYQRDMSVADPTLLESVTYDGNTDAEQVRQRAQFDIDQATLRNTFYHIDVDIESIVCRRGDLVALQHDVLTSRAGDGYIASIQYSGGSPASNIIGVTLDSDIPFSSTVDMHSVTDMHAVTDMHEVGLLTGIVIRHTDGTLSTHQIASVSGNALTFTTPISPDSTIQSFADNDHEYGCMVVAGELDSEYRRLLVQAITPNADLKASITLVDEAPTLVRGALTDEDGITVLTDDDEIPLYPG